MEKENKSNSLIIGVVVVFVLFGFTAYGIYYFVNRQW